MTGVARIEGRGQRSGEVAARLRELIARGELRVGKPIRETELSLKLGVSRTPLREAFKMLAMEGLITINPNRGAVVTPMSLRDVDEVIELLGALEHCAAALACNRIQDPEVANLESMHNDMVACYRDGNLPDYFRINQEIHEAIVEASGNRAVAVAYRSYSGRIRRFRYAGNEKHSRWDRAVAEHEQILQALRDRDGPLLQQVLRSHLRNGWQVVKDLIRDEFEPISA